MNPRWRLRMLELSLLFVLYLGPWSPVPAPAVEPESPERRRSPEPSRPPRVRGAIKWSRAGQEPRVASARRQSRGIASARRQSRRPLLGRPGSRFDDAAPPASRP